MSVQVAFPLQYIRQQAQPIDVDSIFSTTSARVAYLGSPRRYPGQIVSDLQDGNVYVLNPVGDTWISIASGASVSWSSITGKPTTISGYGITDSLVYTTTNYTNPSWLVSIPWTKITSTPTTIAGYGITDIPVLGAANGLSLDGSKNVILGGTLSISPTIVLNAQTITLSDNQDANVFLKVQNTNSGGGAICGFAAYNDAGKNGLFRVTSSGYGAVGFPNSAITIEGTAPNGIFFNARGGATAGIYFAPSGIGSSFICAVFNPAGNIILGQASITPTDNGCLLQVATTSSFSGAVYKKVSTSITGTATLDDTYWHAVCDATSGAFALNLPTATSSFKTNVGKIYVISKVDATVNAITITPNGSDKIDGLSTLVLSSQWDSFTIQAISTTAWKII